MGRTRFPWTAALRAELLAMRRGGASIRACAAQLGCSYGVVVAELQVLGAGVRPRLVWTGEMREALARLRAQGVPLALCAERIGVSLTVAMHEARRLGLAGRLNHGRVPGRTVAAVAGDGR